MRDRPEHVEDEFSGGGGGVDLVLEMIGCTLNWSWPRRREILRLMQPKNKE